MSGSIKSSTTTTSSSATIKTSSKGYNALIVEHREQVLIIKFNRPTTRNALNRRTYYELIRVLQSVRYDPTITIVVLTGVGETFTSGNDLNDTLKDANLLRSFSTKNSNEMEKKRLHLNRQMNTMFRVLFRSFLYCPKILVALVNGVSVGIGFTLAALCDVVYCTENAYFEAPFTRLGLGPEMSSSLLFPKIFGRSKAAEILLFGEKINAEDAYRLGFVARIFKFEELETNFWPKIFQYSLLPSKSLEHSKRLLTDPLREALLQAAIAELQTSLILRLDEIHLNAIEMFFQNHKLNKSKL